MFVQETMIEGIRNGNVDVATAEYTARDIGTIRIAYICSTREYAREEQMETEDGRNASAEHRGSLPNIVRYLERYNRTLGSNSIQRQPRIEVALILVDDDAPERDYSDLRIPMHVEPSSAFAKIKIPKEEAGAAPDEIKEAMARKAAAKNAYEQRLLNVLERHDIDIVVADRYMRIFGRVFLDEFLGLTLNSHPARLPGLEGKTPTADAMNRARKTGYCWHGNTFHIVDDRIDHGPPITQQERTPVYPESDTLPRLRMRNRQREDLNICGGLIGYLRDSDVFSLIGLHREFRRNQIFSVQIMEEIKTLRRRIIIEYSRIFQQKLKSELDEQTRSEAGKYKYSAFLARRRMQQARSAGVPAYTGQKVAKWTR